MGQEERDNHQEKETEQIKEMGALELDKDREKHRIQLLTIIGEIEGHEAVSGNTKATKYEHLLPKLAEIEDNEEIDGVLILLNTMGGDVEAGLAIAEMIASLSKPTVSLVLGGSHSIGGPLAVSADYSFIVPSGTMIVRPECLLVSYKAIRIWSGHKIVLHGFSQNIPGFLKTVSKS